MPPRHVYWTIIVDGKPTAFRAHSPEELAPTLRQLQSKHPDAVLKWFARGKLWDSPEQERAAGQRPAERRGRDWRPGGEHRDPRDRFKVPRDVKRQRFAARQRREGGERGDWTNTRVPDRDRPKRPWNPEGGKERGPGWRPREQRRDREWNPEGRGPGRDRERREWNRGEQSRPPRREWSPGGPSRGPRDEFRDRKPGGYRRPAGGRPPGAGSPGGRREDRRPHGGRPPGGSPPGEGRPRGPGGWRKPGGGGGNRGGSGNRGGGNRGGGNRGGGGGRGR